MIEQRKKLVDNLIDKGYLKSKKVIKAFLKIPRENFIPENLKNSAYYDTPLEIGNRQTISAPHMIAIMCEALDFKEGQKVLEIGTGSGYHAAIVSEIIGKKTKIYSIERFSDLAKKAKERIKKIEIKNIEIIVGDGSLGYKKESPYDIIYLTCAAPNIPKTLIEQLKDSGKLLIPVGKMFCDLILLKKDKGEIIKKNLGGCAFVPLIGKYGHK